MASQEGVPTQAQKALRPTGDEDRNRGDRREVEDNRRKQATANAAAHLGAQPKAAQQSTPTITMAHAETANTHRRHESNLEQRKGRPQRTNGGRVLSQGPRPNQRIQVTKTDWETLHRFPVSPTPSPNAIPITMSQWSHRKNPDTSPPLTESDPKQRGPCQNPLPSIW